jgi:hypothetical protein
VAGISFSLGVMEWHLYHFLDIKRAMYWQVRSVGD